MPSVLNRARELERKFLKQAPKENQEKIKRVLEIYKDHANVNFTTVQNMVLALYSPSLFKNKATVQKMYENFLSKHQDENKYPEDSRRTMTASERIQERRDRLLGVKKELPHQRHPLHAGKEAGEERRGAPEEG